MLRQRSECCDIMVIRRQNFVTTMDFYVSTLIEKFLKKNVAILFCYVATKMKQMAVEFYHNNQTYVTTKRAKKGRKNIMTIENYVATKNGRAMRQVKTSWLRQRFQCCNKQFN